MNFKKQVLKDNAGNKIAPITSPAAVVDSNGKTLETKLTEIDNRTGGGGAVSQWDGKTWNILGDSISDQNFSMPEYGADGNNKWHYYVKPKLNVETINHYASSGAYIAKGSNSNNLVDRMTTGINSNAHLITVFAGTNDYGYSTPPGNIDSTDTATIYGALHFICQKLVTNHPTAKYAFFTPLRRSNMWGASTGVIKLGRAANSTSGLTLENIADIILEVGAYYSIPVLDLQRISGIEPANTEHKTRFMPDGLHPNSAGHERISNVIAEFLKGI